MAFLDRLLLFDRVALFGRRHDRGVDDLAAHRQEAFRPERLVKAPKQAINGVGLLQRFAERPDRVGVWNPPSANPSPRKRMKDSRSLIRNSVRSSDSACIA